MNLEIHSNIESNEDGIFGCATVPSLGYEIEWEYDEFKNRIVLGDILLEGRGIRFSFHNEDPFIEKVLGKIIDDVTAFMVRAEIAAEIAAENAKDEITDMKIDEMIEARHGNQRQN